MAAERRKDRKKAPLSGEEGGAACRQKGFPGREENYREDGVSESSVTVGGLKRRKKRDG